MLPGLAMEYSVDKDGMLMTFTVSKVDTQLDQATKTDKFSLAIPYGYETMSYKEFTSLE